MPSMSATTPSLTAMPEEAYLSRLMAARLLLPTSVPGIYGRGAVFISLLEVLERRLTQLGRTASTQVWQCPPVLPHHAVEKYDSAPAQPQHPRLPQDVGLGDLALAPAACCYVYPTLTGTIPSAGRTIDIESWCYRSASSLNPMQMRAFRMREFVHAGTAEQVLGFRESWIERAQSLLDALYLPTTLQTTGSTQELIAPLLGGECPTALLSINDHEDHFGKLFAICTPGGSAAHTACIAFGMERLALALLSEHGLQPAKWPQALKEHLGLG
jgi:hypothetical protein